jgi:hypothetical protein
VIDQRSGFFTHALNLGKKNAAGDLMLFTDDDATPPPKWIEKYVKLHLAYPRAAGIASRGTYIDLREMRLRPAPDDRPNEALQMGSKAVAREAAPPTEEIQAGRIPHRKPRHRTRPLHPRQVMLLPSI